MSVDLSVPAVHLHIGGDARTSGSGGVHQHVYPATGEVQGPVPLAGPDDVDAAVQAAHARIPASGVVGGRLSARVSFAGSVS